MNVLVLCFLSCNTGIRVFGETYCDPLGLDVRYSLHVEVVPPHLEVIVHDPGVFPSAEHTFLGYQGLEIAMDRVIS